MSVDPGRDQRRHPEKSQGAREGDHRTPAEHDRDRNLYSPEFRRLSGITQVISPSGNHPTHNRLTHTLEVAQIAKAMAINVLRVYIRYIAVGSRILDRMTSPVRWFRSQKFVSLRIRC
jgi:dGTP triphosphohydrolase